MTSEQELRLHRCCFSGHRPEKLGLPERKVKKALSDEILRAIDDGYVTFITGMARGVDLWAGEIVLREKRKNSALHLIAAVPYEGFDARWSWSWRRSYQEVLSGADIVRFICPGYSRDAFQRRNEWMVDRSSRLIAVFNGTPGGTKNTLDYAARQKRKIETFIIGERQ